MWQKWVQENKPPQNIARPWFGLLQHCRQSLRNVWCSVKVQSSSANDNIENQKTDFNELLILQRACQRADDGLTIGSPSSWTRGTVGKSGNRSRSLAQRLPRNTCSFWFPFNLWDVEVLLGLFLKSGEALTRLGFFSPVQLRQIPSERTLEWLMGPSPHIRVCSHAPLSTPHYIYIHFVEIVRVTWALDKLEVAGAKSIKTKKKNKITGLEVWQMAALRSRHKNFHWICCINGE